MQCYIAFFNKAFCAFFTLKNDIYILVGSISNWCLILTFMYSIYKIIILLLNVVDFHKSRNMCRQIFIRETDQSLGYHEQKWMFQHVGHFMHSRVT